MKNETEQIQAASKEAVYNFLVEYMMENCYAPSIREICAATYLSSTSTVHSHLQALEDEGRIKMKANTSRAIKLAGYKFVKTEESA